jgi:hypothetical protein
MARLPRLPLRVLQWCAAIGAALVIVFGAITLITVLLIARPRLTPLSHEEIAAAQHNMNGVWEAQSSECADEIRLDVRGPDVWVWHRAVRLDGLRHKAQWKLPKRPGWRLLAPDRARNENYRVLVGGDRIHWMFDDILVCDYARPAAR